MTQASGGSLSVSATLGVIIIVGSLAFASGAGTHALLFDTATADSATIEIAKQNQGPVTFKKCDQVQFEPDNVNDFSFNVTTGDATTYRFDELDFNTQGNKNSFKVQSGKELHNGAQIQQATLDGSTYSNQNYPAC